MVGPGIFPLLPSERNFRDSPACESRWGQLAESSIALREVYRNPGLPPAQFRMGRLDHRQLGLHTVALIVYAYDAGGVSAVGLVGLIR